MFPAQFDYHRAESVDHALDLIAEHPGAELLAGGHSLIPTMKSGLSEPDDLIDIGDVAELQGLAHDDDAITVGAMTNYATVADDDAMWDDATAVAEATQAIGDIQVRNRGTFGGNVAHADPASDLPAAILAADATVHAQGPDGARTIPAEEFFLGMYANALAEDELLTAVEIPRRPTTGGAYEKRPSPSSGYALVGVAASLDTDDGEITAARVAANGVMDHGVRLDPVEERVAGLPVDDEDALVDAAEHADDDLDEAMMMDDLQASPEFRAQLVRVYARKALLSAAERAGGSHDA